METLNRDYWQRALTNLAAAFNDEKVHLCQLDGAIGDGDHGASMARGFAETEKGLSLLGEPPAACAKAGVMKFMTLSSKGGRGRPEIRADYSQKPPQSNGGRGVPCSGHGDQPQHASFDPRQDAHFRNRWPRAASLGASGSPQV